MTASAALLASGGLMAGIAAAANPPQIETVAGTPKTPGYAPPGDGGLAVQAKLSSPTGVAEDAVNTLYIGDTGNNRVRKVVNPNATTSDKDLISTIAGTGVAGFSGDGGPATSARLSAPTGVAVSKATTGPLAGAVYIADTGNSRVRRIDSSGTITTVAGGATCKTNMNNNQLGTGVPGTSVNICLSGSLAAASGLALDNNGDLFISDTGHNVVRELLPSGKIVLFAGKGSAGNSDCKSGSATSSTLSAPTGVAVDANGNVYIGDTGANKVCKVDASGNISTFVGTGLKAPTGVAVDTMGFVYISDTGHHVIDQATPTGVVSKYAGTTGVAGFSGDLGPATAAKINTPTGLVADGANVYFGDTGNHVVRGIFTGAPPVLPQSAAAILLPITGGLVVLLGVSLIWLRHRRRPAPAVTG